MNRILKRFLPNKHKAIRSFFIKNNLLAILNLSWFILLFPPFPFLCDGKLVPEQENMKFKEVAQVFEQISMVSGRLEITELLANLFKKASPEEARIISYFSLGELRPSYEGMFFNFAKKNLLKVIAELTGKPDQEVQQKAKELGDTGLVVYEYHDREASNDLSVEKVYENLVDFEKVSGTGSQEEKIQLALALLQLLDPLSAKYVVRIILGTLRLGFSDMTVLDALSWMEVGNKSLRPKLEHAYNVCADIGLIAETLKAKGIEGIEKMHITIAIPIRLAAAERMPSADDIFNKLGPCVAQPKLDGFRLQIHVDKRDKSKPVIRFFSRNLNDMTYMFPDLKEALEKLNVETLICEGEAISYDQNTGHFVPFQETVKRKRKHGIEEAISEYPLRVYLFDLLYLNGKSQLNVTHEVRRERLKEVLDKSSLNHNVVYIIKEQPIHSAKELEDYFHENIDQGLEGIVVKRTDAHYQPGKRNFNWIKLKRLETGQLEDTIDCVVLGYYLGAGKRTGFGIGALLVGIFDKENDVFLSIAKIGTGLTDIEWVDIRKRLDKLKVKEKPINVECDKSLYPDVWVQPEFVCQILADEITASPTHAAKYALRFPRFMGYRPDKSATEATTRQEIKRLYQDQYKK